MNPEATMQAVWLERGRVELRALPVPAPGPDEALIRLVLAGICGTDLALEDGYCDFAGVPGHEFVGRVAAAPGDPGLAGRRVVGEINLVCGACASCGAGRPNHCERRSVLGIVNRPGVFSEYFTLPRKNLHLVPDAVSDEAAVFTEPIAAACQVLEQVAIRPGDRVLVVGAGRLGQLLARVIAGTGCTLEVAAKYPGQGALLESAGLCATDPAALPPRAFDVVVEATGDPGGFAAATRAVRAGGTIVLKSTYRGSLPVDFSSLVVDEITLVGSRCGPFRKALALLARGAIDPTPMIREIRPLAECDEAFVRAREPGQGKLLIAPAGFFSLDKTEKNAQKAAP